MNGKGSGSGGCLLVIIGIVAAFVAAWFAAPKVFDIMKSVGIIIFLVLVAGVFLFVFISNRISNKEMKDKKSAGNTISEENAEILKKGRENLMNLRRMIMQVKSTEIRRKGNEVCTLIDKILQTLRQKPEKIPQVRQFFNYYVPTLGEVIGKYQRLEGSVVPAEDMTAKVSSYLTDVNAAMNKQYAALFADDVLDMTVDIEAMTMAVKRDGLLETNKTEVKDGDQTINLTL